MKIQHVPFKGFQITHEGKEIMTFSTYEAALDYFETVYLGGRTMPEAPPAPLTDEEMDFDLK